MVAEQQGHMGITLKNGHTKAEKLSAYRIFDISARLRIESPGN
jgi:hypothetical protein